MDNDQPSSNSDADEPRYTRCPACEAVFRVDMKKLSVRGGEVRCGACRDVFHAPTHRVFRNHGGGFSTLLENPLGDDPADTMNNPDDESLQDSAIQKDPGAQILRSDRYNIEFSADTEEPEILSTTYTELQQKKAVEFQEREDESAVQQSVAEKEPLVVPDADGARVPLVVESSAEASALVDDRPAPTLPVGSADEEDAETSTMAGEDAGVADVESVTKPLPTWHNENDTLYDNNPFEPKQTPPLRAPEPQIRTTPINMGGVDQYIVDRPNPLAAFFWFLVSVAFVVLLGLQVKYFFVERFAQDETYRPYLAIFCKIASCELPPRQDPYRFTITHTRVDLHPGEPGALRITVRLLNQARFTQPYPKLRLTLTDRVGRVVGRRTFNPDFYLDRGAAKRLAPGELGHVVFDLARPHEKAVGFVVDVSRRPS